MFLKKILKFFLVTLTPHQPIVNTLLRFPFYRTAKIQIFLFLTSFI